ncbi:MAG TPA: alanine racemase [Anaerolineae bacterium]
MIRLIDLLAATTGNLQPTDPPAGAAGVSFTGFCFDSRRAHPGELFVALKTDRGDGHDFVNEALAHGCTGALVDDARLPFIAAGQRAMPIVSVPDTFKALSDYAAYVVRKRQLPVIAVTGTVGKTSTREAIVAVLAKRYRVFRNQANFNGRLGVPIALGALEDEHQIIVLEMATDAPGEIHELTTIAPPQVGIVTRVSEKYLAYFGSLDRIAQETVTLIDALPPTGLAILNRDDARVWAMRQHTQGQVAGVSAHTPNELSAAIATLVGRHFGVPENEIAAALQHLPALAGRMNTLGGVNGSTLIDDTFSANPASMRAALEATLDRGRAFLVLGDMDQLGDESIRLHRDVGAFVAAHASGDTCLVAYGELARHIADAALDAGMDAARVCTTYIVRDAIDYIRQHARAGDVVLVKGDTSARMERIVAALLADPADVRLLARQEPGWESVQGAKPARPTWLEVDLDAIAYNVRQFKQLVGEKVTLMAVLKADGYGHGAVKVARTALNNGAGYCGVASLNEATALRAANIDEPILILGYTPAWHAREALMRDVTVTLYDLDIARAFSRAALELRRTARVHIKVDTGMGRLGLLPEQAAAFVRAVALLPGIQIEGVFTHFSCADSDPAYTHAQLERFLGVLRELGMEVGNSGIENRDSRWEIGDSSSHSGVSSIRYLHAANSAATLSMPEARLNMVRVGLAMYGLSPFAPAPLPPLAQALNLRPALAWKTTLAQVKRLPAGHPVSYGATYHCATERLIAVIPVGYADGFRRGPANFGEALVRGQRAPIVGRVCMDQTMLDVTDISGARIGDEVVLIGRQGGQAITAEDVAARIGTINYEVVSAILPRVPRVS